MEFKGVFVLEGKNAFEEATVDGSWRPLLGAWQADETHALGLGETRIPFRGETYEFISQSPPRRILYLS